MRIGLLSALAVALAPLGAAHGELASRSQERQGDKARIVRVAVLGDSLAEGLWGSLFRRYWRDRRIKFIDLAKASTGFNAHPYERDVLALLARHPVDLLIVQTGANDRQRVRGLDGKAVARFGTEQWFQLYGQRLAYFLGTMQRHKVPVLWVGLPVMRDEPFDSGMRIITRLHQDFAERHGAQFLDIAGFTADEEGRYAEFWVQPNGRKRRLRHADGVHSWEFGYDRLADHVIEAIGERFPGLLPVR